MNNLAQSQVVVSCNLVVGSLSGFQAVNIISLYCCNTLFQQSYSFRLKVLSYTLFIIGLHILEEVVRSVCNLLQCFYAYTNSIYQFSKVFFVFSKPSLVNIAVLYKEGLNLRQDFFQRQLGQILAVHPGQLFSIINCCLFGHLLQLEQLYSILQAEDFSFIARAPAQKSQIVYNSLCYKALAAEFLNRCCTMTFTQLGTIRSQNHGHMTKFRRLPAKSLVYQKLLRSIGQMLLCTHYMGHAHQMVVNNNSKIVGRNAIALHNYEIIILIHVEGYIAMNQVMNYYTSFSRNFQTYRIGRTGVNASLNLLGSQIAAGTCIAEGLFSLTLLFTLSLQLFRSAEAVICFALINELLAVFSINIKTLRLVVGTIITANLRTFIPVNAKPFQAGKDLAYRILLQTSNISIFDTENQLTTHFAGKKPVKQSSTCTTNM